MGRVVTRLKPLEREGDQGLDPSLPATQRRGSKVNEARRGGASNVAEQSQV